MARPLRIEFAGALYHLTSRGDRREDIFLDDADRAMFLEVLAEVCDRFRWVCHAYCLMGNDYHLVIETRDSTLSLGMRQLNGVFTQRSNRRHRRVGHVFQGRYKAIIVQKESYLRELARYVVLNPVRAGMVRSARDWPWSSYRATAGWSDAPAWLSVDWLLSAFGTRRKAAMQAYRQFISEGKGASAPWAELKRQVFLGDEAFVERMLSSLEGDAPLDEVPSIQHRLPPQSLEHYASAKPDRDRAIAAAYASGGYSMKAIGDHFGLHYSMVSRILKRQQKEKLGN